MFSDVFEITRAWRDADDDAKRTAVPRREPATVVMHLPADAAPPLCPANATGAPDGAPSSPFGPDRAGPDGRRERRPALENA